jgi:hypothetical protein
MQVYLTTNPGYVGNPNAVNSLSEIANLGPVPNFWKPNNGTVGVILVSSLGIWG